MSLYLVEFISVEQIYGVFYRIVTAKTMELAKLYFMEMLYPDTRIVSIKVYDGRCDDPIAVPDDYIPQTTKTQFRVFKRPDWGGSEGGPGAWKATDLVEPIKSNAECIADHCKRVNSMNYYVVCEELSV